MCTKLKQNLCTSLVEYPAEFLKDQGQNTRKIVPEIP